MVARAPDCTGQQSDAVSGYTQAMLYGDNRTTPVDFWVSIPPEQAPASWKEYRSPVRRLRLALYGHPLSGVFWDMLCDAKLKRAGWKAAPGWEQLYVHDAFGLVLSVYVDDFKMA